MRLNGRGVEMVIYPDTWAQVLHGQATNSGTLGHDCMSLSCKL